MRWFERLWRWLSGSEPSPQEEPADANFVRAATMADLQFVVDLLEEHRVEYVVVGGYALVLNGLVRATGDVDIVVRDTPENNARWIAALSKLPDGVAAGLVGEEADPFRNESSEYGTKGPVRLFDEFVVDVLPTACGQSFEDLQPYVVRLEQDGHFMNVLDLRGLLLTKQGVRDKDKGDKLQIEMALAKIEAGLLDDEPTPDPAPKPDPTASRAAPEAPSPSPSPASDEAGPEETPDEDNTSGGPGWRR